MNLLSDKLENFTQKDLEKLILEHADLEFTYKPSSIKKMYSNWLRNEDPRRFDVVFKEKLETHTKKMERQKSEFVSYQVGYLRFDMAEPSYWVHLAGEYPYKVYWASFVEDKFAAMEISLKKFCRTNGVELVSSRTPNHVIIKTVFMP